MTKGRQATNTHCNVCWQSILKFQLVTSQKGISSSVAGREPGRLVLGGERQVNGALVQQVLLHAIIDSCLNKRSVIGNRKAGSGVNAISLIWVSLSGLRLRLRRGELSR